MPQRPSVCASTGPHIHMYTHTHVYEAVPVVCACARNQFDILFSGPTARQSFDSCAQCVLARAFYFLSPIYIENELLFTFRLLCYLYCVSLLFFEYCYRSGILNTLRVPKYLIFDSQFRIKKNKFQEMFTRTNHLNHLNWQ